MEGKKARIEPGFLVLWVVISNHSCFNRLVKIHLRTAFLILVIGIALFVRIYRLGLPQEFVFDEVYFPVFAQNYLTDTDFYDSHPPLGKLLITASIAGFGNNAIGWRVGNVLAGIGLVGITTLFMYSSTKKILPALLVLILLITDPMVLVESRIGLINIFMIFFSVGGMWCYCLWLRKPNQISWYILTLVLFGAAGSVKWIGFGPLAASIIFTIILKISNKYIIPIKLKHILLLIIIPTLVYLVCFLPDLLMRYSWNYREWWNYLEWWHSSSYKYHASLDATHPYGSQWWSWPFTLKPLWLYYKSVDSRTVIGIFEPGNLITWVGGIVGLAWAIFKLTRHYNYRTNPFLLYLVVMYMVTYLPWAFIGRVKFIYHYFLPLMALHMISALALESLYKKPNGKYITIGILIVAGIVFAIYLPLFLGQPIPTWYYQKLMFTRGWI